MRGQGKGTREREGNGRRRKGREERDGEGEGNGRREKGGEVEEMEQAQGHWNRSESLMCIQGRWRIPQNLQSYTFIFLFKVLKMHLKGLSNRKGPSILPAYSPSGYNGQGQELGTLSRFSIFFFF